MSSAGGSVLRVGLTGGLGAGKSSVAKLLAQKGAAVRDADAIVDALYAPGGEAVTGIARVFGREVLDPLGGVDRSKLKARVASDPSLLAALDALVHPLVRQEIQRWFEEIESQEKTLVAVVEAALLVETGSFTQYHRLVVVTAPREVRRRRALAAGFPPALVEQLLARQGSDAERARHAHYLLDNRGSPADLREKVELLWQGLVRDAVALTSGQGLPQGPTVRL